MLEGQSNAPSVILRSNSSVTSGVEVQQKLVSAAIAFGNILRGTFGPRGLDKMLYKSNGEAAVTNDGAKIIAELLVKHPAAKAFVALGESQEAMCGDGVTGCILFASELMNEAGRLLRRGLHPLVIVEGYRLALQIALDVLSKHTVSVSKADTTQLQQIAKTSMTGKGAEGASDKFSEIAVKAMQTVYSEENDNIRCRAEDVTMVKSKVGAFSDSRLINGIVFEKRIELDQIIRFVKDGKICMLTCPLEIESTTRDSEIEITNPEQIQQFIEAEEQIIKNKIERLLETGANAVISQGSIDKRILHGLANKSIFVLGDVDSHEMKNLSRACGAVLIDHMSDIVSEDLGSASIRVERKEAQDGFEEHIYFENCSIPEVVTLEIGGSNDIATEEVIRGIHDALQAVAHSLETGGIVCGGGFIHASAALEVKKAAEAESGRERLAMEAFARALEIIPFTLATNAGQQGLDTLLELRSEIRSDSYNIGVNEAGKVGVVEEVWLPVINLSHSFEAATDAACGLLRVDQVVSARGD